MAQELLCPKFVEDIVTITGRDMCDKEGVETLPFGTHAPVPMAQELLCPKNVEDSVTITWSGRMDA